MPAQQAFPSLESPNVVLHAKLQSAADVIRNGSSLSLSKSTDAKGIDSNAPSQVFPAITTPGKRIQKSCQDIRKLQEENLQGALKYEGLPFSAATQKYKDEQDRKENEWLEMEARHAAASGGKDIGQPVLGMTFCINRLEAIRRFAADSELTDFTDKVAANCKIDEVRGFPMFKKFQRENDSGDPPYFCVSAEILGRVIHTFKDEYITRDKERHIFVELDIHVDEAIEEAKTVMSREVMAIHMRNLDHIDKHNKMIMHAHARCERMIAESHARMQEASLAYGNVSLDQQLKIFQDSKIIEDTMIDEMAHASQAHRDRLKEMRAHPPLNTDEDRL
jgi:hypothetical protein